MEPLTISKTNVIQHVKGLPDEWRCAGSKEKRRMKSDAKESTKFMPARTSPGKTRSTVPTEQSGLGREVSYRKENQDSKDDVVGGNMECPNSEGGGKDAASAGGDEEIQMRHIGNSRNEMDKGRGNGRREDSMVGRRIQPRGRSRFSAGQ